MPDTYNLTASCRRGCMIISRLHQFQDPRELTILSLRREVKLLRMENTYLRQQVKNTAGSVKLDKVMSQDSELRREDVLP